MADTTGEAPAKRPILGVDTGGTFTDFCLLDNGRLRVHKVLSTPRRPEDAILEGVRALGVAERELRVIHGSTVATNAVLEGQGVRTAFVTNRGIGDLLTLARQQRDELYNLQPQPVAPPVPPELCLETGGRRGPGGEIIEPLTEDDLATLCEAVDRLRPEAVAVCLLYSFEDDTNERAIAEALGERAFVSRSSSVLAEAGEYERGVATWLNAYVGPLLQGYLDRLARGLPHASISVMQSSGETVAADQAAARAVHLLLSGPAGGLAGARFVGGLAGHRRLVTFDMGGTSTDVGLVDGEIRLTSEGHIGRYPVAVPMIDLHTIGAGGGSIAQLDAGGLLNVGPASAGADPGPACYGRGGEAPTVTDANVVLGRLPPALPLGESLRLDEGAARAAVGRLAEAMGVSVEGAAQGILRVANERMAQALRVISVERGTDPAGFTLASFGGAGGLHVCALAEVMDMRSALVPVHAGVLSALGMLATAPGRQLSLGMLQPIDGLEEATVESGFAQLSERACEELAAEGVSPAAVRELRQADLRYRGQSYTLSLPWQGVGASAEAFHAAHEARYGHRLETPVELVNLRLEARADVEAPSLPEREAGEPARPLTESEVYGEDRPVPVWHRDSLVPEQSLVGPCVVVDAVGTMYVDRDWSATCDGWGNLLLRRAGP